MSPDLRADIVSYVLGGLDSSQRERFEEQLERDTALRSQTTGLLELANEEFLEGCTVPQCPSPLIKKEVLLAVDNAQGVAQLLGHMTQRSDEYLVITDAKRQLLWANDVFSRMCGYSLTELKGRNPGRLLQGPLTDSASVLRLREALDAPAVITEELVNYHRDGHPYHVRLTISPILNADGGIQGYFGLGLELKDREA
jgi:PAS domain S-box-containing protein